MRLIITAAVVATSIMAAAAEEAAPLDLATVIQKEARFFKGWAYRMALEKYCFVDLPPEPMWRPLFTSGISDDFRYNRAVKTAEEHLKVDQSACGPAAAFVESVEAELCELEQVIAARAALEAEAAAETTREAKAAEADAARTAIEARIQETAVCRDTLDAIGKMSPDLKQSASTWLTLRGRVIKCAPLIQVDPTELLAKIDAKIEGSK